MAFAARFEKCVVFTSGMKCIVYSVGSQKSHVIEVPHPYKVCSDDEGELDKKSKSSDSLQQRDATASTDEAHIRCIAISPCGKWLALCDDYKQLSLWQLRDHSLVSIRSVLRRTSRIIFSQCSDRILVADKSGDVYGFSVENPTEDGKLLLGHVSMLLDILIALDGKYIITCDRDEKIRVSCYPNAYNINGYCLGHREFVTQIGLVPHCQRILVSGSGDGTFRFWDFVESHQLAVEECPVEEEVELQEMKELGEDLIVDAKNGDTFKSDGCVQTNFSESGSNLEKEDQGEESLESSKSSFNLDKQDTQYNKPAVKCFCFQQLGDQHSIMIASIHRLQGIVVYSIRGSLSNLQVTLTQKLSMEAEPWDLLFLDHKTLGSLLPREKNVLQAFSLCDTEVPQFSEEGLSEEVQGFVCTVNNNWEFFKDAWSVPSNIPNLYKRWYDNVKDYMEKKKERLEGSKPPSWRGPPPKRAKVQ